MKYFEVSGCETEILTFLFPFVLSLLELTLHNPSVALADSATSSPRSAERCGRAGADAPWLRGGLQVPLPALRSECFCPGPECLLSLLSLDLN